MRVALPWTRERIDPEALVARAAAAAVAEYRAAQEQAKADAQAKLAEFEGLLRAQGQGPGFPPGLGYPPGPNYPSMGMPGAPTNNLGGSPYPLYGYDYPYRYSIPQPPSRKPGGQIDVVTLRQLADSYDVLRACILHLQREVVNVPIQFVARDDKDKSEKTAAAVKRVTEWFDVPGGLGGIGETRESFEHQLIEDVCVIGAGAIYFSPTRGGGVYEALTIDAGTIRPRADAYGWPGPGEAIYEQWVMGILVRGFTREEIAYRGIYPRSWTPFFSSPIEFLLATLLTAIKVDEWNRVWLTEGNEPGRMYSLPDNYTPTQVYEFAAWFLQYAGDSAARQQLRFLPGGSTQVTNPTRRDNEFQEFTRLLITRTCFDDQTEILTDQGWKLFADLDRTERVATRSPEGKFEWEWPIAYIEQPHSGEMVRFKSQTMDALVTPDHRMLGQYTTPIGHPRWGRWKFKLANELVGIEGFQAPAQSEWIGKETDTFVLPSTSYKHGLRGGRVEEVTVPEIEIPMEDWCAFLGLYLAEGSTFSGTDAAGYGVYRIQISQSLKSKHWKEIAELLERLPLNWRFMKSDFYCNDIRLNRYLKVYGACHEKRIPRHLLDLAPRYLEILLEWMIKGDGNRYQVQKPNHSEQVSLITSSAGMAGDLQELAQKIGLDASVSIHSPAGSPWRIRGSSGVTKYDTYRVRFRVSKTRLLKGELVDYAGQVFCVQVPNGVIYTRRNGKPLWAGNCAVMGVQPASIGFLDSTYAVTQENSMRATSEFGVSALLSLRKVIYDDMLRRLGYSYLQCINVIAEEEEALERAERNSKLVTSGIKTPNEARADEGLDPIDGGEELYIPTTLQSVENALNPPMPPTAPPGAESGGDQAANARRAALALWERKALRRLKRGERAACNFEHQAFGVLELNDIGTSLTWCETAEEVRAAFADAAAKYAAPQYHETATAHQRAEIARRWRDRRLAAEREA